VDNLIKSSISSNITLTKKLVYEESVRIIIGIAIMLANTCLLMILNGTRHMQKKFVLYTIVAIGDTIDGLYFIYAIFWLTAVKFSDTNRRECFLKFYIVPRIFVNLNFKIVLQIHHLKYYYCDDRSLLLRHFKINTKNCFKHRLSNQQLEQTTKQKFMQQQANLQYHYFMHNYYTAVVQQKLQLSYLSWISANSCYTEANLPETINVNGSYCFV
uniref:G_PROTEIN_RECEP_F1_2 domain-containing protein n=1 Tax=Syphacia muris TaxID=451379 RepID=A0A0N5AF47_9BILA